MEITLPAQAWLFTRYALMVSESKVTFVSWSKGRFTKLGEFVNDTQGLQDFGVFLKRSSSKYDNKAISICTSLVGEDYRFEKVAHLVGKYRTDMLSRKFQQLFRGTTYQVATYQGREPVGRRQDFYLFCGVLSNEKLQPWIRELTRVNMVVAGVHLSSMMSQNILKQVAKETSGVHIVSVFIEDGNIRHNFYIDGSLRFSRLSRVSEDAQPDAIFGSMRSEIEKTIQYLTSIKLVTAGKKVNIHILCPDDILDAMADFAARSQGDRFAVTCFSSRLIASALGIKRPVDEHGRDSSLLLHEMLRGVRFNQLAPLDQVRYYLARMSAVAVCLLVTGWGLANAYEIGGLTLTTYNTYTAKSSDLQTEIGELRENYENQVRGFGEPPSTPENMRSAVNVLDNSIDETGQGPGRMLLFISKILAENPAIQLETFDWYISNDKAGPTGSFSFANGRKVYEVVELSGVLDPNANPERAFSQFQGLVDVIQNRADMSLVVKGSPALVEAGGELRLTIEEGTNIRGQLNAYSNNAFNLLVAWEQDYDPDAEVEEEA